MIDWKWTGYNALLYLAAMQSIPKDVYEAASLDGAGAWRQLWSITVPMIRPMIIFTVVLSTIGSLQLFAEPVQFDDDPTSGDGGGNQHLWRTVAQLIWHTGWGTTNFGYAGAMSWILFVDRRCGCRHERLAVQQDRRPQVSADTLEKPAPERGSEGEQGRAAWPLARRHARRMGQLHPAGLRPVHRLLARLLGGHHLHVEGRQGLR